MKSRLAIYREKDMIEVTAMGLICAIGSSCEQVVESLKNVTKDSMVRKDNLLVQGKSSFFWNHKNYFAYNRSSV